MDRVDYSFLGKCTKNEIIEMIQREITFRQYFTYRDVLFGRWERKSKEVLEKFKKHTDALKEIDLAERDRLAKQFNSETDINKKLKILKKMEPYKEQLDQWFWEDEKIQKEQEKVDKLYRAIRDEEGI